MMKYLLTLLVTALLHGCGGAGADPLPINPGVNTDPMQSNAVGLSINRPATVTDAYSGGLSVTRNTTGLVGGTPGHVNSASYVHSIAGQGVTAFEWANLSVMDNYASAGENVAIYAQGNKWGRGETWGMVSEVIDHTPSSPDSGAVVGHEYDVTVLGPDNGNRIGLDVLTFNLAKDPNAPSVASVGLRLGSGPDASWSNGIVLHGLFRESAFKVVDPSGAVVFEIKPNGDVFKRGIKVL